MLFDCALSVRHWSVITRPGESARSGRYIMMFFKGMEEEETEDAGVEPEMEVEERGEEKEENYE